MNALLSYNELMESERCICALPPWFAYVILFSAHNYLFSSLDVSSVSENELLEEEKILPMIWKAGMNIYRKFYIQPLRRRYLFVCKRSSCRI